MWVRALVRVAVVQRPDDAVSEVARPGKQFCEPLVGSHGLGQGAASVEMLEPVGYVASRVPLKLPKTASIDRIDSSKGYTKGNVQWVCVFANLAKNTFKDELIKETFDELKKLTNNKHK